MVVLRFDLAIRRVAIIAHVMSIRGDAPDRYDLIYMAEIPEREFWRGDE
jgi:hypothetical protein